MRAPSSSELWWWFVIVFLYIRFLWSFALTLLQVLIELISRTLVFFKKYWLIYALLFHISTKGGSFSSSDHNARWVYLCTCVFFFFCQDWHFCVFTSQTAHVLAMFLNHLMKVTWLSLFSMTLMRSKSWILALLHHVLSLLWVACPLVILNNQSMIEPIFHDLSGTGHFVGSLV